MSTISMPGFDASLLPRSGTLEIEGYIDPDGIYLHFGEPDNEPVEPPIEGEFIVQLIEDGEPAEVVYRGDADACLHWVREWLKDPLGIAVAIVPVESVVASVKGGESHV